MHKMAIELSNMIEAADAVASLVSKCLICIYKIISVVENNYHLVGPFEGGPTAGAKASRGLITASIPKSY